MIGDVIDLFFSFNGRISRRAWLAGAASVLAAAGTGILLFNNDSFDESANAVAGAPTMAAFLWAALALFAFTALSAKRLARAEARHGLWATIAVPGALLVCGWGLGFFLEPWSPDAEASVFWALLAAALPALIACARADRADTA